MGGFSSNQFQIKIVPLQGGNVPAVILSIFQKKKNVPDFRFDLGEARDRKVHFRTFWESSVRISTNALRAKEMQRGVKFPQLCL